MSAFGLNATYFSNVFVNLRSYFEDLFSICARAKKSPRYALER